MARETEGQDELNTGDAGSASSKGRTLSLIALVLGLCIGGGIGWTVVGPSLAAHKGAGGGEGGGGGHGGDKGMLLHTIENLVVNPAESGGMRFLVVSLAIEMDDAKSVQALASRDAELRDQLVRLLSSKTVPELTDVQRRDSLKAEIRTTVSGIVEHGEVKHIYLPLFVIQ